MFKYHIISFLLLALIGCEQEKIANDKVSPELSEWSIPAEEVRDGGVGRDGIPSIDNPTYTLASDQEVVFEEELVTGIVVNGKAVAFPHKILDYHEIVNAELEGFHYAVSFCPLTGTSIVYPREIDGNTFEFGVSGLLFNSNLIMYDRKTESFWPQMMFQAVRGERKGDVSEYYQVIETTWENWKMWYPESLVLDPPNGQNRSYDVYAYGGYRTNHDLVLFPPKNDFTGYPRKERILGVVDNGKMFYFRFNQFENGFNFKEAILRDKNVLVFGSTEKNYLFAYRNITEEGKTVSVINAFNDQKGGRLFEDTEGNVWSVAGEVISGPNVGAKLERIQNYIGYSFAMAAFYPNDFLDRTSPS